MTPQDGDAMRHWALWIAIADGERARIVQPDADDKLCMVSALDSATAHHRSRELATDRPGRAFESAAPGRHAYEPRHDPHELAKERFAHLIAEELNEAAARAAFDELVVAAPARVLHDICRALDANAAERLVGTLEKDLTKVPNHDLGPHIAEWLSPRRRPPAKGT
jgi:protein required for attachment to host cells